MTSENDPAPSSGGRARRVLRRFAFVIVVVTVFAGGTLLGRATGAGDANSFPEQFALIEESWELLYSEYVDAANLDPTDLAYGAISGMAGAVGDTDHTYFMTPEETALMAEIQSDAYGSIGVEFDESGELATVSAVEPGGAAAVAGLKAGDRIIAVDGRSTDGPDGEGVLDRIFGRPGTAVDLLVVRPTRDGTLAFHITRSATDRDATDWAMIPGTTLALVQLTDFPEGSAGELHAAVSKAIDAGATGLVLDLRGNPGGYVHEAIGVAGVFLRPGTGVHRERLADATETIPTVPTGSVPTTLPVVVLVDGDSASSAEIVAGALQDAKRATIVGTTTAGTGTILLDYELTDGSVLSIGAERWLTPSGRSVWHVGLTPDVTVELPAGATPITPDRLDDLSAKKLAKSKDAQLLHAISLLESDGS